MVNEGRSSDPTDAFTNYSILSLFPRTFGVSTADLYNSNESNNIDSVHSRLLSMELRSPRKLLEQAKMIVDEASNLTSSNLTSHVPSEGNNKEDDVVKGEKNHGARRPGLELKRERAKFEFKLNLSEPATSSHQKLDMDEVAQEIEKLQDPEEYFLAHKRLAIAKKEIEKQKGGVLTDLTNRAPHAATQPKQRRQGLFGVRRKTGRFKELYSQMRSENEETFTLSQKIIDQDIPSPINNNSQKENNVPDVVVLEREHTSTISMIEKTVGDLFNELMSKNHEDLEGDGAITLLKEHLQIKPFVIDKLSLPDLHDIPKIDFKDSGQNSFKSRNLLLSTHSKLKEVNSQTPAKQREAESSGVLIGSPSPPKSPFAAISLLKRRISQANSSDDPFSAVNIDLLPSRTFSPAGCTDLQFSHDEAVEDLNISVQVKSPLHEDDTTVGNMVSYEVVTDVSTSQVGKYANENSNELGVDMDGLSNGLHGEFDANAGGCYGDEMVVDDEPISCDALLNASTKPHSDFDNQEAVGSVQPDIETEDIALEVMNSSVPMSDHPSLASGEEDIAMDQQPENANASPKKCIEELPRTENNDQAPSEKHSPEKLRVPNKEAKRPHKVAKSKQNFRRQSLAAAGTNWASGVRRSTRIKMRPLEYWKGERFLYGRIHNSLATVIGVKYASPGKGDGESTLKVKSYVSDQYKDLVELAALH